MKDQLQHYCDLLAEHNHHHYTYTMGRKFIRIVQDEEMVYCFVDYDGNLYKADSWARPAKGIRGHISKPLLELAQFYRN